MSADLPVLGWKEQVSLPEWGIAKLRAKLDTGARSSALHVEDLEIIGEQEERDPRSGEPLPLVRFDVLVGSRTHPNRVTVQAPATGFKVVRDTGANHERRPVVRTRIVCGPLVSPAAEVTLTARHGMNFRMLVGRLTMAGRCLVDPAEGYIHTQAPPRPAAS